MSEVTNREFRKIPTLEYLYEVNDNGTCIRNVKSKRPLKCFRQTHNSNTEYWCTQINIKHKNHKVYLHKVVAECWHGKIPYGMQVDHIDRNSLNNDYRNLRYVTKSEQMLNRDYDAFIDKILPNLKTQPYWRVNPVRLTKDGKSIDFPSARKASKYLSEIFGKPAKSFNDKFHLRRHHIYGYDVEYLNAETRHGNLNR